MERLNADSYAMQALKKVILKRICFDGTLEEGTPAEPLRNFMLNVVDAIGKELSDAELGAFVVQSLVVCGLQLQARDATIAP